MNTDFTEILLKVTIWVLDPFILWDPSTYPIIGIAGEAQEAVGALENSRFLSDSPTGIVPSQVSSQPGRQFHSS